MKRGREDNGGTGPTFKRQAASRAEASSLPVQSQCLTTDDAIAYLKAVKHIFKDNQAKYDKFLEIMKDFKAQRTNTLGVIERVKELFKGHHDLILGFNTFLPKGYEMTLEEFPKKQPVKHAQAISYVKKIKTRFQQDELVYKAFLATLNMYRMGNKSISEVYQEVAALFRDHPDLLEEFTYFLPNSTGVAHHLSRVKGKFLLPCRQPQVKVKQRDMADALPDDDCSSDKPGDGDHHDHIAIKSGEKPEEEHRDEREKKRFDLEQECDEDWHQSLPNKHKFARRADGLILKQLQGGEGGQAFMGPTAKMPSMDEKKLPKFAQQKLAFFELVKGRLQNHESYQEFLQCINLYSEEIITREQLNVLVDEMFQKFPELIKHFNEFLTHCECKERFLANFVSENLGDGSVLIPNIEKESLREKDQKINKEDRDKDKSEWERDMEREKERNKHPHREVPNHKLSNATNNNKYMNKPVSEDREKDKSEWERDMEREKERNKHPHREVPNHKLSNATNNNKYMNKPVSELDLLNCRQCTPSYRLLPEDYPMPKVSSCTPLGHIVLNDTWISVTSGSEDHPFKHMRKNQYEESLFRCEDDRFELDMLLESTGVTTRCLEQLLERMQETNIKEDQICIDDHLTAIQLRCIERIYGDHGLDVLDLLRKNVGVALPVVVSRLKQKQVEWLKCREDMNKVWAEVYAKNYLKSLDHRSFHFKQQDMKSLSTKAILAEIKEINEKKKKGDDFIMSIAAGNTRPLIPDLKFKYPEPNVNEDLYQIIKHSANEMCTTAEQSDKIMGFWKSFLEPIFGAPHGAEDTVEITKLKPVKSQGIVLSNSNATGNGEGRSLAVEMRTATRFTDNKVEASRMEKFTSMAYNVNEMKQDADRWSGLRWGKKIPDGKADLVPMDCSLDDITQNGCLERVEKEEGEISLSQKVEEKHVGTSGSGDSCVPLVDNIAEGKALCKVVANHYFEIQEKKGGGALCKGVANQEDEGGHNADGVDNDEEESAQRTSEGSGNGGSEAGEERLCSESGDDEEHKIKNGSTEGMVDAEGDGSFLADTDLLRCMPLVAHDPSISSDPTSERETVLFYGNDNIYVLLRLHQALYERIHAAKVHAAAAERKLKTTKDDSSPDLYRKFLRALYGLLDGTADNAKYEDVCRLISGTQSYLLFTMDKLIFKLVKQLQAVASDEMANKLVVLHSYQKSYVPGGLVDAVYHANASVLLHDENIYRFEWRLKPSQIFIQLLEGGCERSEISANAMESRFTNYLHNFLLTEPHDKRKGHPIFLRRNKLQYAVDDDQTLMAKAFSNVHIANGLEYKISCNSYKVSYVLDTEDFLHRRNRRKEGSDCAHVDNTLSKEVLKFHRWLDSHMSHTIGS